MLTARKPESVLNAEKYLKEEDANWRLSMEQKLQLELFSKKNLPRKRINKWCPFPWGWKIRIDTGKVFDVLITNRRFIPLAEYNSFVVFVDCKNPDNYTECAFNKTELEFSIPFELPGKLIENILAADSEKITVSSERLKSAYRFIYSGLLLVPEFSYEYDFSEAHDYFLGQLHQAFNIPSEILYVDNHETAD